MSTRAQHYAAGTDRFVALVNDHENRLEVLELNWPVPGPPGPQGPAGAQGPQGPPGPGSSLVGGRFDATTDGAGQVHIPHGLGYIPNAVNLTAVDLSWAGEWAGAPLVASVDATWIHVHAMTAKGNSVVSKNYAVYWLAG